MEKKFKIKSKGVLNKMDIEDYINYYESALIAWNNKNITNEEMYDILDNFSERAYGMITFLMGCCNLSNITFHHIETNLLALRLEVKSLLSENKDKENIQTDVLQCDALQCIEDINDLCEISIKGLSGSFRKDGESILKEINSLQDVSNLQDEAMEKYIQDNEFVDGAISEIIIDEEVMDGFIDNLGDILNKEGGNEDNGKQFQQQYFGIWMDTDSDSCVADLDADKNGFRIDNKADKEENFYCRIIDQNTGIDREFKNLNDVKEFINRF